MAKFWRPIAYIPNLHGHGHLKGDTKSPESVQDEHSCIRVALQSLVDVTKQGGIATKVQGKAVICKVWIHYIIGVTSGSNRWVGHYNNSGKKKRPYRDCMCGYETMDSSNPQ